MKQLNDMLKNNFITSEEIHSFQEIYFDDDEFTNIKRNTWLKKKILNNTDSIPTSPKEFRREIKLNINRTIFKHKNIANIKITKDEVVFENEDNVVVFVFSTSIPESELSHFIEIVNNQPTELDCFPVRSAIQEYLFRYEPSLYKLLGFKGYIIPSPDFLESEISEKPTIYQKAFGIRCQECKIYEQELQSYSQKTQNVLRSMTKWPNYNFIEYKTVNKRIRLTINKDLESKLLQMKREGIIKDYNLDMAFQRHFIRLFEDFEISSFLSPYIENG